MKIALVGATGFVGSAVLKEALNRGHEVTAVLRTPEKLKLKNEKLKIVKGDVLEKEKFSESIKGNDVVISAFNPGWENPNIYNEFLEGARAIQEGVKNSGVQRFIVVGGAGSLFVAPGLQLIDTPEFPAEIKPGAEAAREYLEILKGEDELDWTFLSPAAEMHPGSSGERKGKYRTALDNPVFNEENRSIISVEDAAVALIDEAEEPKHIRQRFTIGY
ncbi:MAG TPA: NAD(P)-dependent oxidoreductase [Salinimicrobium sp.]|nr:NAD(P)-dependent oxidoreductase [Salinimicrobium sp.]